MSIPNDLIIKAWDAFCWLKTTEGSVNILPDFERFLQYQGWNKDTIISNRWIKQFPVLSIAAKPPFPPNGTLKLDGRSALLYELTNIAFLSGDQIRNMMKNKYESS